MDSQGYISPEGCESSVHVYVVSRVSMCMLCVGVLDPSSEQNNHSSHATSISECLWRTEKKELSPFLNVSVLQLTHAKGLRVGLSFFALLDP